MDRSAHFPTRAHTARFFVHALVSVTLAFLLMACGGETIAPPVDPVAAQVVVEPNGHTLEAGDQLTFTTRVFDSKGAPLEGRYVTWSTSDVTVANVSSSGVVTGLTAGSVSISATVDGTVGSARLDITNGIVASVTIGPADVAMQQGESKTLSAIVKDTAGRVIRNRAIAWMSSDPTVVAVDPTGTITAIGVGIAEVTATIDEITARVMVNVTTPSVEQLIITPSDFTIEVGETRQLDVVLKDKFGNVIPGRPVLWTADNESVRIEESGRVTGLQAGEVTIIATSEGVSGLVKGTVVSSAPYPLDLVYDRVTFGGLSELFILSLTNSQSSLLSTGTMSRSPTASPDGSRVAFAVSMEDSGTGQHVDDIYVVDRAGSNMQRLTTAPGVDEAPAWSPAGARIAYQHRDPYGRSDIWAMDPDGSNAVNLTVDMLNGPSLSSPAWTRDGSRIAFVESLQSGQGTWTSIWTMRSDGSEKWRVTSSLTAVFETPTWSPDGTRIAFVQHFADETDIAILTVNGGPTTRLHVPGAQSNPSWSPDGSLIAFTSDGAIYTMRPDGTNLRLRTVDLEWGLANSAAWIARP